MRVGVLLLLMVGLIQIVSEALYSDQWTRLAKTGGYWRSGTQMQPLKATQSNVSCPPMARQRYVSELFLLQLWNSSVRPDYDNWEQIWQPSVTIWSPYRAYWCVWINTTNTKGPQLWGNTHRGVHASDPCKNSTFQYKVVVAPGTNWSLLAHDDKQITEIEEFQPTRAEVARDFVESHYEHTVHDRLRVDFVVVFSRTAEAIADCAPGGCPIPTEVWDVLCGDRHEVENLADEQK